MGKKQIHRLNILVKFVLLWMSMFSFQSFAQLVTKIDNPSNLVQNVLLGPGVKVTSVKYNGASMAIGYFNGSKSNIGLKSGIIMTTGTVVGPDGPVGPNNTESAGMDNGYPGSALLNQIIAGQTPYGMSPKGTFNAATLEIEFVPMSDTVRFRYVFGSEEYPEFVGSEFNDVFAFFISGPGIAGMKNIALLPNGTPVTINNVNDQGSPNAKYYINNEHGLTVQYDGFTTPLTAMSAVQCGKTYTLTITIADVGDAAYDSGIFLEANSLSAKVDLEATQKLSKQFYNDTITMAEGCTSGRVTIHKNPGSKNIPYNIPVVFKGSAIQGIDFTTDAPATLVIPVNKDSVSFNVVSIRDNLQENLDSIVIDLLMPDACGNTYTVTKVFYIKNIDPIKVTLLEDTVFCAGDKVTLAPIITGGMQPYSYVWSNSKQSSAITVSPSVTETYDVTVSDICFNSTKKTDTVIVMKYQPLQLASLANITEICPYLPTKITANPSDGAGFYKYAWSDGQKIVDVNQTANIKPPKTTFYTLTVTDRCGQKISKSFLYTITSPPLITHISPDTTICMGDSAILIAGATGGYGKYTYKWKPSNDTTSSIVVKPTSSSEYFVFVGDACKTFTVRDTANVFVSKPPVSFKYVGTPIIDDTINFINESPKYPKYSWDFGNGTRSNERDPSLSYSDSSVYNVVLTIQDSIGCKNSDSAKIQIYYPYSLYVPNSFTPNGDGLNDYFMPIMKSVVTVDFTIYDRWGEIIYYSTELRPRWDGTYKGVPVSNDTYTYKIQVVNVLEELKTYTGSVTIWR